jgi:protein phosphatase
LAGMVAHAGMKEEMQGRGSGAVRSFALFGETTGETDEYGFPVRYNWAAEYRGRAMVVYGHTPVAEPEWLNRTGKKMRLPLSKSSAGSHRTRSS